MKSEFQRIKTMATNRGLNQLVALAAEGIDLCEKKEHIQKMFPYNGARDAAEHIFAQEVRDLKLDKADARIAEIMTLLNADESWITAPLLPTSPTADMLGAWCEKLKIKPDSNERNLLLFAARGYLGMCRHPFASEDWSANNHAYCDWVKKLKEIVGNSHSITSLIEDDIKNIFGMTANF